MNEKRRFKLVLLTSLAAHFLFILFFPALGFSIKPPLEYVEVSLVKPQPAPAPKPVVKEAPAKQPAPKPVVKKVVAVAKKEEKPTSVKLTSPAKKEAEQPKEVAPVVKKSIEPTLPEISPVKISAQPAQKLPAIPPRVSTRSEIEVPLVEKSLEPTLGGGVGGSHPLAEARSVEQGEERLFSGERSTRDREGFPEGVDLPSKATSYAKGGIAYEKEEGEGPGGSGQGRIKGPLGEGGREILRSPEPKYPDWAQEQGVVGKVDVKCWVLPTGEVNEVRIENSSGTAELDECASRALMKWRFERIEEEGRQWGIVPFDFNFEAE